MRYDDDDNLVALASASSQYITFRSSVPPSIDICYNMKFKGVPTMPQLHFYSKIQVKRLGTMTNYRQSKCLEIYIFVKTHLHGCFIAAMLFCMKKCRVNY